MSSELHPGCAEPREKRREQHQDGAQPGVYEKSGEKKEYFVLLSLKKEKKRKEKDKGAVP